jgi:hypothetical protein
MGRAPVEKGGPVGAGGTRTRGPATLGFDSGEPVGARDQVRDSCTSLLSDPGRSE